MSDIENTSDLISRSELLKHIKDLPTWWADEGGVYDHAMKYPEGMFDVDDIVNSIENAEPVLKEKLECKKETSFKPMKMQSNEPEYMCKCGYKLITPDNTYGMKPDKYCRECGQRLDWSDVIE